MLWTNKPREKVCYGAAGKIYSLEPEKKIMVGKFLQGLRSHMQDLRPVFYTGEAVQKEAVEKFSGSYA